jgi:GGDEF domain-containing protein
VSPWGGEEFLVLLRGATPGNLRYLAERCRHWWKRPGSFTAAKPSR